MLTLTIIVIHDKNTKSLDVYRTKRSIQELNLNNLNIDILDWYLDNGSISQLSLNSSFCMFLIAGDLISQLYVDKFSLNLHMDSYIILQPQYIYEFNQNFRMIAKNIDINKYSSVYDVLMLRYFASRHFVSKSEDFLTFIKNFYKKDSNDSNFIWSYLVYLLNQNYQLICLQDTVGYEQYNEYLSARIVKGNNSQTYSAPKLPHSDYKSVLDRSNLDNIIVYEKAQNTSIQKPVATSKTIQPSSISSELKSHSIATIKNDDRQKPISHQNISEAVASDGLALGLRLTMARLVSRAKHRIKDEKISLKEKVIVTSQDVKETLNIK